MGSPIDLIAAFAAAAAAKSFVVEYCGCTATVTQAVDDAMSGYVANEGWSGKGGGCGGGNTYSAGKAGKKGKASLLPGVGVTVSASSTSYQMSAVAVAVVGAAVVAAVLVAVRRRRFASQANTIDVVVEIEFVDESAPSV